MIHFEEEYFHEEVRENFLVSSMMKRAWAAQIEVLEEIKRVCNIIHIPFGAGFGTLLGTVRHKGFIPWDDDLDICMLRRDYLSFLEKAPEVLDDWYELKSVYNDPTDDVVKARIINGRHVCFDESFLEKFHRCPYVVGVDIFPVDNIPDNEKQFDELIDSLNFLLRVEASIPEEGPYDGDVLSLMKQIENTYGISINYNYRLRHEIKRIYDILCTKYVDDDTAQVGCMMGVSARRDGFRYPRSCYQNYIEMPFENTTMPVPSGYDQILKSCYGADYMTPKNVGSSHDYPFYKEQMKSLKEVMEQEFQTKLSDEMMKQLIEMKILENIK